jgi:hypothetical protein
VVWCTVPHPVVSSRTASEAIAVTLEGTFMLVMIL